MLLKKMSVFLSLFLLLVNQLIKGLHEIKKKKRINFLNNFLNTNRILTFDEMQTSFKFAPLEFHTVHKKRR